MLFKENVMKKIMSIVLVFVLLIILVACDEERVTEDLIEENEVVGLPMGVRFSAFTYDAETGVDLVDVSQDFYIDFSFDESNEVCKTLSIDYGESMELISDLEWDLNAEGCSIEIEFNLYGDIDSGLAIRSIAFLEGESEEVGEKENITYSDFQTGTIQTGFISGQDESGTWYDITYRFYYMDIEE
jgi:hypothetical protein